MKYSWYIGEQWQCELEFRATPQVGQEFKHGTFTYKITKIVGVKLYTQVA